MIVSWSFDYMMMDRWWIVDTGHETHRFRRDHDFSWWWIDHRAPDYLKKVLAHVMIPTDLVVTLMFRYNFEEEAVIRYMEAECLHSSDYGCSARLVEQAGSSTQPAPTRSARRTVTGRSARLLKQMAVPTVISGGVRK